MRLTRFVPVVVGSAAAVVIGISPALAQGYALRGGASVNPDQVYGGVQYEIAPIVHNVWLTPSIDAGFGNQATLIDGNIDFLYRRPVARRSPWTMHVGGGPALNYYRLPFYSRTAAGIGAVAALSHASGWFTQLRLGFLENPDFRLGVGYRFTRRPSQQRRTRSR